MRTRMHTATYSRIAQMNEVTRDNVCRYAEFYDHAVINEENV